VDRCIGEGAGCVAVCARVPLRAEGVRSSLGAGGALSALHRLTAQISNRSLSGVVIPQIPSRSFSVCARPADQTALILILAPAPPKPQGGAGQWPGTTSLPPFAHPRPTPHHHTHTTGHNKQHAQHTQNRHRNSGKREGVPPPSLHRGYTPPPSAASGLTPLLSSPLSPLRSPRSRPAPSFHSSLSSSLSLYLVLTLLCVCVCV
jgi:hypothetical protein